MSFIKSAEEHRESAAYYERIARLADQDGDEWVATYARNKAAKERQAAREIEARSQP